MKCSLLCYLLFCTPFTLGNLPAFTGFTPPKNKHITQLFATNIDVERLLKQGHTLGDEAHSFGEMQGNSDEAQWLVTVKSPLTTDEKSRMDFALAPHSLGGYFPHNTFMLVAPLGVARKAEQLSNVLLVLHFDMNFKFNPDGFRDMFETVRISDRASEDFPVGLLIQLSDHHKAGRNRTMTLLKKWKTSFEGEFGAELSYAGPSRISVDFPMFDGFYKEEVHTNVISWMSKQHEVHWIQRRPSLELTNYYAHGIHQGFGPQPTTTPIWDHGIHGEGQIVALGDIGLDHDICFFTDPEHEVPFDRVDYDHRKIVTYYTQFATNSHDHDESSGHGSHTGCTIAGDALNFSGNPDGEALPNLSQYNGMAPKAKLAIYDTGSQYNFNVPDDLYENYLSVIYRGTSARIYSNSWADQNTGDYDLMSQDFDRFMYDHQDFLIIIGAGNHGDRGDGYNTIATPSNAKNTLTVGSVTSYDQRQYAGGKGTPKGIGTEGYVSYFSSRGPTQDGRLKPDILAVGEYVKSAKSDGVIGDDNCNEDSPESSLDTNKGTSMASSVAAGHVALIRQYFMDGFYPTGIADDSNKKTPSAALLKATVIASGHPVLGVIRYDPYMACEGTHNGSYCTDLTPLATPSLEQGFGVMTLEKALAFSDSPFVIFVVDTKFDDDWAAIRTLDIQHLCFRINGITEEIPFRATLVWTDREADVAAGSGALVNDLDLFVRCMEPFREFFGNGNLQGNHSDNSQLRDNMNNVEQVNLDSGDSRLCNIQVQGINIPDGPQNYALFVSGDFEVADLAECDVHMPVRYELDLVDGQEICKYNITMEIDPLGGEQYEVFECPGSWTVLNYHIRVTHNDDSILVFHTYGRNCGKEPDDANFISDEATACEEYIARSRVTECEQENIVVTDDRDCVFIWCENEFMICDVDLEIIWSRPQSPPDGGTEKSEETEGVYEESDGVTEDEQQPDPPIDEPIFLRITLKRNIDEWTSNKQFAIDFITSFSSCFLISEERIDVLFVDAGSIITTFSVEPNTRFPLEMTTSEVYELLLQQLKDSGSKMMQNFMLMYTDASSVRCLKGIHVDCADIFSPDDESKKDHGTNFEAWMVVVPLCILVVVLVVVFAVYRYKRTRNPHRRVNVSVGMKTSIISSDENPEKLELPKYETAPSVASSDTASTIVKAE